uniref:Uncharacterized protein n=1 Tax=Avena sativa TaxID=4498 RepID=A0ACD6ACJ3_AVESA
MDHRKQQQQRSSGAASSGKHGGGKGGKAGTGAKKPIKVVYISNPMRVKTSAADFRALVQDLTGRHADPSKYGAYEDAAAARVQQELSPQGSAAASTPDAGGPGPAAVPEFAEAAFGDGDEEDEEEDDDDVFRSQLLDNNYSVFSPPTLLYDYPHPHGSSDKNKRPL